MLKRLLYIFLLIPGLITAKNYSPQISTKLGLEERDYFFIASARTKEVQKLGSQESIYHLSFKRKPYLIWPREGSKVKLISPFNKNEYISGKIKSINAERVEVSFRSLSNLYNEVFLKIKLKIRKKNVFSIPVRAIYSPTGKSSMIITQKQDGLYYQREVEIIDLIKDKIIIFSKKGLSNVLTSRLLFVEKLRER